MGVCNETVWKVIDKARELEDSDDNDLSAYVLGAAVGAVENFALEHLDLTLSDDDALAATIALFKIDHTPVFNGDEDPEVLNAEDWAKHLKKLGV